MIIRLAIIVPIMMIIPLFFDIGLIFRIIWFLILLVVLVIGICYAVGNIKNGGIFLCRLTDHDFSQFIPDPSYGESFQVSLSEITQVEVHNGFGEGPSDEWYIHTENGRHRITTNYGNPDRKFGVAIQKSLPHINIIETSWSQR